MTSRDKRFAKIIFGNKTNYRYDWVKNFLEYYYFYPEKQGSSHIIFRRNPYPHITIVTHGNHVKRWYVKNAIKILRKFQIIP